MMDSKNPKELDEDLIFYYYGVWMKSHPLDAGKTTINALNHFDFEKNTYGGVGDFEKVRESIKKVNSNSLSNAFLMRLSTFIIWYYYRNKQSIVDVFKSKDKAQYVMLYKAIKSTVKIDNRITHPNPEVFSVSAVYVFIALSAMCDYNPSSILQQVTTLISDEVFDGEHDCQIKDIIEGYLDMFSKTPLDQYKFFKSITEKHVGCYTHAIKLLLFYLYFFDDITVMTNENKFISVMYEICNWGGDTDTNCAIVFCVLGAIVGYHNMGKYFDILVTFVPKKRYFYSTIMVYFYVNYLKESQKKIESGVEDNAYQFRAFRDLMTIVNTKMGVTYIKK